MPGFNRLGELKKVDASDSSSARNSITSSASSPGGSSSANGGGGGGSDGSITGSESTADITEHMQQYEEIKHGLELIQQNAESVERLKAKTKTTANDKVRQEAMQQMDKLMATTGNTAKKLKLRLESLRAADIEYAKEHGDSAKVQMRSNLYQTHIRRFQQIMNDYNASTHAFKQELQKRSRREVKIVDSSLTDEEVEEIVESGRTSEVIKQALVSDSLQDVVRNIEERHLDILKLERQVAEIFDLFRDLAVLVDLQQESLDVIEERIMNAKNYTERAEAELIEAEDYQRKARNRRCCIFMIVFCILAVIILPIILPKVM